MIAIAGVELETLVSEPDALTTFGTFVTEKKICLLSLALHYLRCSFILRHYLFLALVVLISLKSTLGKRVQCFLILSNRHVMLAKDLSIR